MRALWAAAVSLGPRPPRPACPGAEPLTDVAEPPGVARGAGTDGGPGGHNQVAGAPIQARAAQASWGRAQKLGSGRTPGWSPLSPFPWHGTPSGKALPPAQLGYLCGVCPHTGPGPPHTRTAPRGSGARGPSCRPPPGTRSGSRRSISLGTTPCVPALCTPLPRAAPPHTGAPLLPAPGQAPRPPASTHPCHSPCRCRPRGRCSGGSWGPGCWCRSPH